MAKPNMPVSLLSGAPTERQTGKARPLSSKTQVFSPGKGETVVKVGRHLAGLGVEAVVAQSLCATRSPMC